MQQVAHARARQRGAHGRGGDLFEIALVFEALYEGAPQRGNTYGGEGGGEHAGCDLHVQSRVRHQVIGDERGENVEEKFGFRLGFHTAVDEKDRRQKRPADRRRREEAGHSRGEEGKKEQPRRNEGRKAHIEEGGKRRELQGQRREGCAREERHQGERRGVFDRGAHVEFLKQTSDTVLCFHHANIITKRARGKSGDFAVLWGMLTSINFFYGKYHEIFYRKLRTKRENYSTIKKNASKEMKKI